MKLKQTSFKTVLKLFCTVSFCCVDSFSEAVFIFRQMEK